MDYQKIKQSTEQKFATRDFQQGDIFSEMLSYWEIIVKVELDTLYVIQRVNGKFELKKFTIEEYVNHCQYSSGRGYWIDFMGNNQNKVKDYIEAFIEQEEMTLDKVRDFKLDLML